MNNNTISPNSLAFLALSNEYCRSLEQAEGADKCEFIAVMIRLLPRIYICVSDISINQDDESFIAQAYLDEPAYDDVRNSISSLMGEDDTYLEVFTDEMKYSDSPVCATVSENLADIYQSLYDATEGCRDATPEMIAATLSCCREDFSRRWGQTLVNVLRAIHSIAHNTDSEV